MADSSALGTVIPVVFGSSVISVVVTQALTWLRDGRAISREVAYLGLRLASKFERFAEDAAGVVGDISDYRAKAREDVNTTLPEVPALPDEKERWRDLSVDLTARVLAFDERRRSRQGSIDETWNYGDSDGAIETARVYAVILGMDALRLSKDLRTTYKLPRFDTPSAWPTFLSSQFDDLPAAWKVEAEA